MCFDIAHMPTQCLRVRHGVVGNYGLSSLCTSTRGLKIWHEALGGYKVQFVPGEARFAADTVSEGLVASDGNRQDSDHVDSPFLKALSASYITRPRCGP
jgi:hypothetical protein